MRGEANGEEERQQPQPPRGEEEQEHDEEEEEERQPPQQRHHGQRAAPMPSSGQQQQQQQPVAMRNVGYVGKHRLSAAIARLDQELQTLQDELNELDTMEPASAACQEVITSTEGKPDPLLPMLMPIFRYPPFVSATSSCKIFGHSTHNTYNRRLCSTSGPENSSWDRWFQRVRSSRSNKWWASKGSDFS